MENYPWKWLVGLTLPCEGVVLNSEEINLVTLPESFTFFMIDRSGDKKLVDEYIIDLALLPT